MPQKGESLKSRSIRYSHELTNGTNSITGEELTPAQRGYRMGVLNERLCGAYIHAKKTGQPFNSKYSWDSKKGKSGEKGKEK
jgi:hypothetical protein